MYECIPKVSRKKFNSSIINPSHTRKMSNSIKFKDFGISAKETNNILFND